MSIVERLKINSTLNINQNELSTFLTTYISRGWLWWLFCFLLCFSILCGVIIQRRTFVIHLSFLIWLLDNFLPRRDWTRICCIKVHNLKEETVILSGRGSRLTTTASQTKSIYFNLSFPVEINGV